MNIGIFGSHEDSHVKFVAKHLEALECKVCVLEYNTINKDDYCSNISIYVDRELSCFLNGIPLSDFSLFWFWPKINFPYFGDDENFIQSYLCGSEWKETLRNFHFLYSHKFLNDDLSYYRSSYKIAQLKTAIDLGFQVPRTLISNNVPDIKKFSFNNQSLIIKMLGSPRTPVVKNGRVSQDIIFTNRVNKGDIYNLNLNVTRESNFLQQEIEKQYELRVPVIGEKVFAFKIDSQSVDYAKIDWRYAGATLQFENYILPKDISNKLVEFLKIFNRPYGVFDLIKSRSGHYIFLECNPQGTWAYLDHLVDYGISKSIAELIVQKVLTSE